MLLYRPLTATLCSVVGQCDTRENRVTCDDDISKYINTIMVFLVLLVRCMRKKSTLCAYVYVYVHHV